MADLKMPEINSVIIAGNLTKDPVYRTTTNGTPVVNFSVASNRRYRDSKDEWQEDVCYVGVVAWNKLADSCKEKLRKGNACLVEGELQSRTFKTEKGDSKTIVEIKARRIQFLNKAARGQGGEHHDEPTTFEDDSFEKHLSPEDTALLGDAPAPTS
ncbi:MAG TPA: single-stranded DNA-binding protein [Ignavibacteria bacterium]|nr:single-stranded DNA-binding protein [Ignavibacteria bacterium]